MTDYTEFTKQELEQWVELCMEFFDDKKIPKTEGGALLSVYGRLIKFSEVKGNELAFLRARAEELEAVASNLFQACSDLPLPEMNRMEKEINAVSAALKG